MQDLAAVSSAEKQAGGIGELLDLNTIDDDARRPDVVRKAHTRCLRVANTLMYACGPSLSLLLRLW